MKKREKWKATFSTLCNIQGEASKTFFRRDIEAICNCRFSASCNKTKRVIIGRRDARNAFPKSVLFNGVNGLLELTCNKPYHVFGDKKRNLFSAAVVKGAGEDGNFVRDVMVDVAVVTIFFFSSR